MDDDLEAQLYEDYPLLYAYCQPETDAVPDPTPPIVIDGIACGDGWFPLLDTLSHLIETNVNEHDDRPLVHATQVKQKWGMLRVYTDPMPDIVYGAARFAEQFSANICEACGTVEGVDQRTDDTGWQTALCPDCDPPTSY